MLYLVTGASGSGKTVCLSRLRDLNPEIYWYDFDEGGVPSNASKAWRQTKSEHWVKKAIQHQTDGHDTGVSGGIILGEVLACPSASQVNVAACLLDCYDVVRIDRLIARGLHGATLDMLCWAAWQRMHAVDPRWRPDVIREGGAPDMRWERWETWQRNDPRWRVTVIDTTEMSIEDVAAAVSRWIEAERLKRR
ncbi:MAG TPA: hypothetical protein VIG25_25995 [Pyrinomonadaceae bacterium]|jgi:hypothetical protein